VYAAGVRKPTTYDVDFELSIEQPAGTVDVTGMIVTNGATGALAATDFTSWQFTFSGTVTGAVTGGVPEAFSGTGSGGQPEVISPDPLVASASSLTIEPGTGGAGGEIFFHDASTGFSLEFIQQGTAIEGRIGGTLASGVALTDDFIVGPLTIATAVPGPIAGAGLPGLLLAGGGFLGWWRRRKKIA
jgi:hypothetical protein